MPNITLPMVSLESSVETPIFFTIARDVKKILNLQENTQLVVYNSLGVARTDIEEDNLNTRPEKNFGEFDSKRRLEVRINEEFDENGLGTGYTTDLNTFPIFRDTDVGVSITPMYANKTYEFEFTFTAPSKAEINHLRDLVRNRLTRMEDIIEHIVEYTMILPEAMETFITDVHALKNRLYPIDRVDYFKKYATNRIHLITDMVHKENVMFAIKEIQEKIFGTFEWRNDAGKSDNKNETNSHSISFTYRVSLEIPNRISMMFPIMICNRLMRYGYLKILSENAKERYDHFTNHKLHLGRTASVMQDTFSERTQQLKSSKPLYPINIPDIDDYSESMMRNRGYVTVMSILCEVDENDKRTLLNLRDDLDPWYIPDKILEYIKGKGRKKVFVPNTAFIYIGLEQRGRHYSNMVLTMDDDFNVKSLKELELLHPVRVTIKVCIDPTFIVLNGQKDIETDNELLETVIDEYIELKDKFDVNDDMEESRILYIIHLLIKKFDFCVKLGDCRQIRRFVEIVRKDDILAYRLGSMLTKGFPILTSQIRKCGVFTNGSGKVDIFDEDPIKKEQQEKGEDKYRDDVVKDGGGYDFQIQHRGTMNPYTSRTVMTSSIVALRRK